MDPLEVSDSLYYICQAIASWHVSKQKTISDPPSYISIQSRYRDLEQLEIRSEDVKNEVSQVLIVYKNVRYTYFEFSV